MRKLLCGSRELDLSQTRVMGILNATPDSFSDGGQLYSEHRVDLDAVLQRASGMVNGGAAVLDVGGESTRPGAGRVSIQEELDRVVPVVECLVAEFDVVVSVDTSSPEVMSEAARAGAGFINDVRALRRPGAQETAVDLGLPVCLMHMPGDEPSIMQSLTNYSRPIDVEAREFLLTRARDLQSAGLGADKILVDPGFGFGKTLAQNIELLNALPELVANGFPVLVGASRKSMIGAITGRPVDQRLAGSLAFALLAAQAGAKLVRVHDVRETHDVLKVLYAMH